MMAWTSQQIVVEKLVYQVCLSYICISNSYHSLKKGEESQNAGDSCDSDGESSVSSYCCGEL